MSWVAIGESSTGTGHFASNVPCQDSFRYIVRGRDSDFLIIAVADGAGSASMSEIGSQVTCDSLISVLRNTPEEHLCKRETIFTAVSATRMVLIEEAAQRGVEIRQLACTVLIAILGPTESCFAQIGDGAIVVGNKGIYQCVFWPAVGEYANETNFITEANYESNLQFINTVETADEVAVFSDGIQRLALDYSARVPMQLFFGPLFRSLRETNDAESLIANLRDFLNSDRVNQRTDDDKTLVFAIRK